MKKQMYRQFIVIVLLSGILFALSQILAGTARAQGPSEMEKVWEGHIWEVKPSLSEPFTAPAGAVKVTVLADWKWKGSPDQKQHNEQHRVEFAGHVIPCDDYGDEEHDTNGDGTGEQWVHCGAIEFERSSDLTVDVKFSGDDSSSGSHLFRVIVRWQIDPVKGSVSAVKIDEEGQPWAGVTVKLYKADGAFVASSQTPANFEDLDLGSYYIEEEVPAGSEPISPTRFDFSLDEQHLHYEALFQNKRPPLCKTFNLAPKIGQAPLKVSVEINYTNGELFKLNWGDGSEEIISLPFAEHTYTKPGQYHIIASTKNSKTGWVTSVACQDKVEITETLKGFVSASKIDEEGRPWAGVTVNLYRADGQPIATGQTPVTFKDLDPGSYYIEEEAPAGSEPISPTRFDFTLDKQQLHLEFQFQNKRPPFCSTLYAAPKKGSAPLMVTAIAGEGSFTSIDWDDGHKETEAESLSFEKNQAQHVYTEPGRYYITAQVAQAEITTLSCTEIVVEKDSIPTTGQYQDFVGAVPFGLSTPYLEPGKEYFDGARSVMVNVEYISEAGQGEVIFRFNGEEISGVTTSIFQAGSFRQIESKNGRAATVFAEGTAKLIAYRYGVEQARIFQTISAANTRWIHPLDQPFEHKYQFELELHGPATVTDLLIYGQEVREIQYDANGLAIARLAFTEPGLVAVYALNQANQLPWATIESMAYPITRTQIVGYSFGETGLYHYRIVDDTGQVVAGPGSTSHLNFSARPGMTYHAQLAYPATSLFVGLYDDMKFEHPDYWLMPVDGRFEHDFEFHLDYHRLPDPNLGDDHIRGDIVVDGLSLTNGTTSVAQQFPYGRHDGALPGVNIVGIPNVSMVAFCQRPGVHEVAYWGGWENESYYLPERGWVFDQELYDRWTEGQRGDCIDAARRVNMLLAREGLRTDHTYRHHGEKSQGYQMAQLHIWSAYNLVGMRPPHLGQLLKQGTVLPYYENPEEMLFWGWSLDKGGLAGGIGLAELRQHVEALGPVTYVDYTGIHPAEELN
jgi:PKD repeat protein